MGFLYKKTKSDKRGWTHKGIVTKQTRGSKGEGNMNKTIDPATWVYVVVQNPGPNEAIVGQQDTEGQIAFIPVFKDRESASQGVTQMVKAAGQAYEIQAIIYDDLLRYAGQGGFLVFFLDGRGQVLSKVGPDGRVL